MAIGRWRYDQFRLRALIASLALLLISPVPAEAAAMPPVRHVFIVVLENESSEYTFGPKSPAPYLAKDLVRQGAYLENYYGIGHASLDNYIAMISGQLPNYETQSDCQVFTDFIASGSDADGQAIGHGCVYPSSVPTIADQLSHAGLSWKSYAEDMGNDPSREAPVCGHPAIGQRDPTQRAQAASPSHALDQYATRHNPFMYFHSIIDAPDCAQRAVGLTALDTDLKSAATTANLVFITPNLCNDGHDGGEKKRCVDGEPGGLVSADQFLRKWIPAIIASPAFQQDGLLVITFDESEIEGRFDAATHSFIVTEGDTRACCGELAGPNISDDQLVFGAKDKGPGIFGPGGGRIGAVLLSPFIKPGTLSKTPYNHFSLLKSMETIFGLPTIGMASTDGLQPFGSDVFIAR